jgi:hypothetical protein
MQRYTIFFIIVNALHVSGGFSAQHQELKKCTDSIWYVPGLLLLTLAWLVWNYFHIPDAVSWAPDDGRRNRPKHVEHWQQ